MNKDYLNIAIGLNECSTIMLAAAKNALYMDKVLQADPTQAEYGGKLQRMSQELPYLLKRVEDLKKTLREFNGIAMG